MPNTLPGQPKHRGNRATQPRAAVKRPGVCQWCRQPILWGRTPARWGGKWIALDPEPHPRGDYAYIGEGRCLRLADHGITTDTENRRVSHLTTCGTTKAPAE